jgi:uncharacterized protein (DUF2236 family)
VAHPLVAEGVAQHSGFRADPWARLAGTLRSYLRIVFGSGPAARAEIRRLNALHRRVTGNVRDPGAREAFGPAYAARDPELGLWVHATLVESTLAVTAAWQRPMPEDRRARFYAETLAIGRAFGIPADLLPPDVAAFDAYVAGMLSPSGPVHPTATSRELARAILRPPLAPLLRPPGVRARLGPAAPVLARALGAVPRGATSWLLFPAIGLLPPATRAEYGFRWGSGERLVAAWLARGWMAWRPLVPERFRWFPQALAADRRIADGR